jgi:hypothetical protein
LSVQQIWIVFDHFAPFSYPNLSDHHHGFAAQISLSLLDYYVAVFLNEIPPIHAIA